MHNRLANPPHYYDLRSHCRKNRLKWPLHYLKTEKSENVLTNRPAPSIELFGCKFGSAASVLIRVFSQFYHIRGTSSLKVLFCFCLQVERLCIQRLAAWPLPSYASPDSNHSSYHVLRVVTGANPLAPQGQSLLCE